MIPDPLHPVVVHFPIVLVVILPVLATIAAVRARRGTRPRRDWATAAVVSAALFASAFAAVRTGEAQEDRVEAVVSERVLHDHEEAAERFLVLSGTLALVALLGLAGGRAGEAARWVATVGSIGLLLAGVQVGDSGGDLVYRYGAANAYVETAAGPVARGETEHEPD